MNDELNESALLYHRYPKPGKIEVTPTKPLSTQRDLALAYSPGVAAACNAIVEDESQVNELTSRANLVAVISNGTAVLGLGNIGPLASKPVMEGKAVLFKKFAGIDVFDIEINECDPKKLVDIIASLEPTFGAINLEDIKAPECFEVEQNLIKRMKIPVFHDDQHGTAIIAAAAVLNGLELVKKKIGDIKVVTSGAGAAAIACLDLLVSLGVKKENIFVTDMKGVIYKNRSEKDDQFKKKYAQETKARDLGDIIEDADLFLGLSAGNVLKAEMVKKMAKDPLILALANPTPEIDPVIAREARPDAIIATGRSDFPNQVNNVLCFPFIFRGALDVGATVINTEMKMACVKAIAALARAEPSDMVANAYQGEELQFGPNYIIPSPFDPRLILKIAPAVAKAAMETGVATRPITNFEEYNQKLYEFVFRSGLAMKPIFSSARENPKRLVYAEGEDPTVLRAIQVVADEKIAHPIIIGRKAVVISRIEKLGLRLHHGKDYTLVDPESDHRYKDYWMTYHAIMEREGVSPEFAKTVVRTNTSVIAALMVFRDDADAMLAGPVGRFKRHLKHIMPILSINHGDNIAAALNVLVTSKGMFFFCDTYVNQNPSVEQLTQIVLLAATHVRQYGIEPKIALLSHSNFGSSKADSAEKVRLTLKRINEVAPDLEIDGEMHADAAIDPVIRNRIFPNSKLKGSANLLIMPDLDSANISFNLAKVIGNGQPIGPILLGLKESGHILTQSSTVRSIVNMSAIAVVEAQTRHKQNANKAILDRLSSN